MYLINVVVEHPDFELAAHVLGPHTARRSIELRLERLRPIKARLPGG